MQGEIMNSKKITGSDANSNKNKARFLPWITKMVVTDLAKTKIKELLQQKDAKYLNIALAGNTIEGINTIITIHNNLPHSFITISSNPEILVDPLSYPVLSAATLDFNSTTGELLLAL